MRSASDPASTAAPGTKPGKPRPKLSLRNIKAFFSSERAPAKPVIASVVDRHGAQMIQRTPDHVDTTDERTVYSFGGPPVQEITLKQVNERPVSEQEYRRLSDEQASKDGSLMVNVSKLRFNAENGKLVSHSFTSCTPIVAFYPGGKTALYHAFSAARDDDNVADMLSQAPSDIFVITRKGTGNSYSAKQARHAASIVESAPPGCKVHILELPETSELAVSVTPGAIKVKQGRTFDAFRPISEGNDPTPSASG